MEQSAVWKLDSLPTLAPSATTILGPFVRSKMTRLTAVSGKATVVIPFLLMPPTPKKQIFARAFENELMAKSPTKDFFCSKISPPLNTIEAFEDAFLKIERPLFVNIVTFSSAK